MLEPRPAATHGCSEHHKAPTDDADPDDQPPLHLHPIPTVISTAQSTYPTHPSGGDFMKYMWQPSMRLILLNQPPSSERGGSAGAGLQHPQHWQLLLHPQSLSSVVISNVDEALNINSVHSLGLQQPTSLQGPSPSITAGVHLWLLIYHPSAASSSAFRSCHFPQPHYFPCGQ
jgi:hypothetical protein